MRKAKSETQARASKKFWEKTVALRKIILILQTFDCASDWRNAKHRISKQKILTLEEICWACVPTVKARETKTIRTTY